MLQDKEKSSPEYNKRGRRKLKVILLFKKRFIFIDDVSNNAKIIQNRKTVSKYFVFALGI